MKKAFTLVEVLTVLVIILVLAAITFPVASSAKTSARETEQRAYLRQGAAALLMYRDESGDLPSTQLSARDALRSVKTCVDYDPWNPGCKLETADPVIGSWGYARLIKDWQSMDSWQKTFPENGLRPLLTAVMFAPNLSPRFQGDQPADANATTDGKFVYPLPDIIFAAYEDGSVRRTAKPSCKKREFGESCILFSWPAAFYKVNLHGKNP